MNVEIVYGNIVEQQVDVIVNAWNRNFIPWWLLFPKGVSKSIKKAAGYDPFNEIRKHGLIKTGQAILTGPGRLQINGIIHVAGINQFWFATKYSIETSVKNAMKLADEKGFVSIAFPLIGGGTGRYKEEEVLQLMVNLFETMNYNIDVIIVRFG